MTMDDTGYEVTTPPLPNNPIFSNDPTLNSSKPTSGQGNGFLGVQTSGKEPIMTPML